MRKQFIIASLVFLASFPVSVSAAAVDCSRVNRELRSGRWPEDVALGMGITLADVKHCQDEPAASKPPASAPAGQRTAPKSGPSGTKPAPSR